MAISFVGAGTPSAATGNPTPTYPAGLQALDIVLLHIFTSALLGVTGLPAGFTLIDRRDGTSANQLLYYYRAAGGESGTISQTISSANLKFSAAVAYRGCIATGAPYEALQGANGTGGNIVCPNFTTLGADRMGVYFTSRDRIAGTPTQPATWTDRLNTNTATSTDATLHDFDKAIAAAGVVTGPTITYADAEEWFAHGLGLIPAAGGGGGSGIAKLANYYRRLRAA